MYSTWQKDRSAIKKFTQSKIIGLLCMELEKKVSVLKILTQSSYWMLFIALTINLWIQSAPLVIYFLTLFPLSIFTVGIVQNKIRTLIWLCFVLLLYFTISIYKLSGNDSQIFDKIELILCICLFIFSCVNARIRQKNGIN